MIIGLLVGDGKINEDLFFKGDKKSKFGFYTLVWGDY